jgi:hypothetical protein
VRIFANKAVIGRYDLLGQGLAPEHLFAELLPKAAFT